MATKKQKQEIPDNEKLYSSEEVMQILPCNKNTLTKLRRAGEIVFFKKGRFSFSYPKEQFTLDYMLKKKEQQSKHSLKKK